ncbi:MAG: adenosine deaminase, partial [Geodermatophilaceae bacterium]|nr:adenosine deaminase [Geodermatophilaceae bacterium]
MGRPQFAAVFARTRALGLVSVPHAGETTGSETVWDAINSIAAQRIDADELGHAGSFARHLTPCSPSCPQTCANAESFG